MRRLLDRAFLVAVAACGVAAAVVLVGIVGTVLALGLPALDLEFLTRAAVQAGAGGGILYQLAGTVILVTTALALAVPLATGLALLPTVYLARPVLRRRLSLLLYGANAVPSILFGLVGLILFGTLLGWGKSWLAGGLVLGLMILPTVTVAFLERIQALPGKYLEAGAGLGLSRSQLVWAVILPQCRGGLLTGSFLGMARAAGETAPILFTAAVFSGVTLPAGIKESPVLALPYHIFVLAQDSLAPAAQTNLWGAAFVLLAVVTLLSLAALPARSWSHEEAHHG